MSRLWTYIVTVVIIAAVCFLLVSPTTFFGGTAPWTLSVSQHSRSRC